MSSSEASLTFGHANANLNHYHYSFRSKLIPYTVYKHRKICICLTKCRAGFAIDCKQGLLLVYHQSHEIFKADMTVTDVSWPWCSWRNQQWCHQRVETTKREMFSQKSVRRFVGDSSAFVVGAMLLPSALNKTISPRISNHFWIFPGGYCLCLGHWLWTWHPWRTLTNHGRFAFRFFLSTCLSL